jgi:signal peptidase II
VALIVAGGIANVVDRLEAGSVVDMLHTGWWPTFNLADVYITTGVALWLVTTIKAQDNATDIEGRAAELTRT